MSPRPKSTYRSSRRNTFRNQKALPWINHRSLSFQPNAKAKVRSSKAPRSNTLGTQPASAPSKPVLDDINL